MSFTNLLLTVLPVFIILGTGTFLRAIKAMPSNVDKPLMQMVFNVFYPCLIFVNLVNNNSINNTATLISLPLVGLCTIVVGFAVASLTGGLIQIKDKKSYKAFTYSGGIYNYGFMAYPLVKELFPENLDMPGMLFLFNTGIDITIWSLGIIILTGFDGGLGLKRLINGPLIALIIAIIFNMTGANVHIPPTIIQSMEWLGQCAIPLGLLLSGTAIAEHYKEMDFKHTMKAAMGSLAVRSFIMPLLMIFAAVHLSNSKELSQLLVIQSAMPAAMFSSVVVRHYKCCVPTSLAVIITTTIAALGLTPFWISYGLQLLEESLKKLG